MCHLSWLRRASGRVVGGVKAGGWGAFAALLVGTAAMGAVKSNGGGGKVGGPRTVVSGAGRGCPAQQCAWACEIALCMSLLSDSMM